MITTLLSIFLAGQGAASVKLQLLPTGAMSKVGFYVPQRLPLSTTPPEGVKAVASGTVEYGTLNFGGKKIAVAEISENGSPTKVVFDFAGKGDLASGTRVDWTGRANDPKDPNSLKLYQANVDVPSPFGSGTVSVSFYRFDPRDTRRPQLKDTLLYYGNYALEGTVSVGGKDYHAVLADTTTAGAFGKASPANSVASDNSSAPPASLLLLDRDGDGKFKRGYEWYDSTKPFNIGGTTYELTGATGSASKAGIRKSSQLVAELPMPSDKALSFTATDTSGRTVHFPQDFKGRVVLLDFWATWCGPCMGEVPNVVEAYKNYHPKGFEILGISLDNSDTIKKIEPVTKENGMTWNQIADGKYWKADIAVLYKVDSIPHAYLVDGDTGHIYADGDAIRGANLVPAIQKALAEKAKSPK